MSVKSADFKFFAKIVETNYTFCCSSQISFNPRSHLKSNQFSWSKPDIHLNAKTGEKKTKNKF